jgi:nitrate reductase gamma subunit
MEAWIDFARGPLFLFAFSFMVLGLLRVVVLTAIELRRAMRRAGDKNLSKKALLVATVKWLLPVGQLRHRFVYSLTSVLFHIAIILVPIFLAGHIALWERGLGISWPALDNRVADGLTLLALVTAAALLLLRLGARATRALSRPQDYLIPLLVALPFASGFLVMHPQLNPFGYQATLLVHVLSGNLVFILMPVTKLSHAVLMPSVQTVAAAGWHFPPDAGSRVATSLGKEGEPV